MARVTVSVHCPLPLYNAVNEYVESDDSPDDASISNTFAGMTRDGLPPEYRPDDGDGYEQPSPVQDAIAEALEENGPMHREDISQAVGTKLDTLATILTVMRKDGAVRPTGGGVWALADEDESEDEATVES